MGTVIRRISPNRGSKSHKEEKSPKEVTFPADLDVQMVRGSGGNGAAGAISDDRISISSTGTSSTIGYR